MAAPIRTVAARTVEDLLESTIDKFWETFPPIWNRLRGNVRGFASEQFGISVEQFHILRHIRKGVHSACELAEASQISRAAISQTVDLMVEKGLIARTQDPRDRRYVRLKLTPEGDRLISAIFKRNRAWMSSKMASLSAEDHGTILEALALLKAAFDEGNTRSTGKVLAP